MLENGFRARNGFWGTAPGAARAGMGWAAAMSPVRTVSPTVSLRIPFAGYQPVRAKRFMPVDIAPPYPLDHRSAPTGSSRFQVQCTGMVSIVALAGLRWIT